MMQRKRTLVIIVAVLVLPLLLASCTPGSAVYDARPAGFWAGLWHGFIMVITLIISLFSDTVRMYEVNNTGWWYDFGFLLGASLTLGGGGFGGGRRRKK